MSIKAAADILADACPVCPPPFDHDACPAAGEPEEVSGGTVTSHQCGLCGSAWSAFWRDGWVIDRLIAPVAPDDAGLHRGVLTEALDEHARERGYAA
jgi:hypothetical protein